MNGKRAVLEFYGLAKYAEADIYDKPNGWLHAAVPGIPALAGAALTAHGALRDRPSSAGPALMALGALMAPMSLGSYVSKFRPYAAEQSIKRPAPTNDKERKALRELLEAADPEIVQKLHARFSMPNYGVKMAGISGALTGGLANAAVLGLGGATSGALLGGLVSALRNDSSEEAWDRTKRWARKGGLGGLTLGALSGAISGHKAQKAFQDYEQQTAARYREAEERLEQEMARMTGDMGYGRW